MNPFSYSRICLVDSGVYLKEDLDLGSILARTASGRVPAAVGCYVMFLGIVRGSGLESKQVSKIEIESYKEHADKTIGKICEEVKLKHNVVSVEVYHLMGGFDVGEPVVLVVIGASHRQEAYPALHEAVERYKTEAALWKKEVYADGSHAWIGASG